MELVETRAGAAPFPGEGSIWTGLLFHGSNEARTASHVFYETCKNSRSYTDLRFTLCFI